MVVGPQRVRHLAALFHGTTAPDKLAVNINGFLEQLHVPGALGHFRQLGGALAAAIVMVTLHDRITVLI
jgi:hypothetical protein